MAVSSFDSQHPYKSSSPAKSEQVVKPQAMRLQRTLGALETYSFGLTGHVGWIGTAPVLHAALGPKAFWVWLPGVIVSMLLNFQVQRLAQTWTNLAGGTPNYAARLLGKISKLGPYVAIGYFVGWAAAPVVYAIVLTDLIKVNLQPIGLHPPEMLLKIGFTAIAFIVGLSGTRALAILQVFFVLPGIALLIAFCVQGLGWLAFSPDSPGLIPSNLSTLPSFGEWAKWFFISTYSVYSCETAASFVADSKKPAQTARFLGVAAWLIPVVFLGCSWVMMQLAVPGGTGNDGNLYVNLVASAKPFWGESASLLVTVLITTCCLVSSSTTVANTSRVLYQLALDGHLSPVFTVVSKRGVLGPALLFTLILSLICLLIGNLSDVVTVTGVGYLISIMGFHLGLWMYRHRSEVRWAWLSLGFFIVEAVVLVVGCWLWSPKDLILGLLFPGVILAIDVAIRRIPFALLRPKWWMNLYYKQSESHNEDVLGVQVFALLGLISCSVIVGWVVSAKLHTVVAQANNDLLVILIATLAFISVAIACWTTLPQITAIEEAREKAENLFYNAIDATLILDTQGRITQTNLAAEKLFEMKAQDLTGYRLNKLVSLPGTPDAWSERSQLKLIRKGLRILESTVLSRNNQGVQEYVVTLRDISDRQQVVS
ncbi:APC family permease [Aliterella atlantica]|uniref:APC family permease n=1 Tax=Aliterella atlantica TaxID=1827278 RepID=UPI0006980F66|nr:APC family permease [Aliterella atlantica]